MPRFMKTNVSENELKERMQRAAVIARRKILEDDDYEDEAVDFDEVNEGNSDQLNFWIRQMLFMGKPADLEKIEFSTENVLFEKFDTVHGSAVAWAYAGGDWEYPVYFVIYIDDKNKLRFYIPSDGNTYCHECKHAYGSCICGKGFDKDWDEDTAEDIFGMFSDEDEMDFDDIEPEWNKMRADVESRLQIK